MDSWDNDEFEVPTIGNNVPQSWDDEEEEEQAVASTPAPVVVEESQAPKVDAVIRPKQLRKIKMKEMEEKRKADHIATSQRAQELAYIQANETPAERKAREQKAIEEADFNNVLDAFGAESPALSLESKPSPVVPSKPVAITVDNAEELFSKMTLFSLQDFQKMADLIVQRLDSANRVFLLEFMKILLKKGSTSLSADDMKELTTVISIVKNEKIAAAKPKTKKKKQTGKSAQESASRAYVDEDYYHEYDEYDDFM